MAEKISYQISEEEEMMALDFVSGVNILESFRKAYPNTRIDDTKARYRAKKVLARGRVQNYIRHLRESGEVNAEISEESLDKFLWNICKKNPTNSVGLRAAIELKKKFTKEKENNDESYDDELLAIHGYHDALMRGEKPEMPKLLLEGSTSFEDVEFEVIGKEEMEFDDE